VLLEPGFSTADAEYPDFALQGNTLFLDFVGWHGQHVRDALMMSLASAGTNADHRNLMVFCLNLCLTPILSHHF